MLQFSVDRYIAISSRLTSVIRLIERAEYRYEKINDKTLASSREEVGEIKEDCRGVPLKSCVTKLEDIEKTIDGSPTYDELALQYKEFYKCLYDEISEKLFLCIPTEKQQFYLKPLETFGVNVSRFESAREDIEEAGKSYATSRNTACVFHLMRVIEIGLRVLAKHFHLSDEQINWELIMKKIQDKIHEIDQLPKEFTPEIWQSDHRFYSEAAMHLTLLQDAYRNFVIHNHEQYNDTGALAIYNHASSFMKHLGARLSE
ncbi:hypothetical protein [Candidatus Nitronereus thalassa]|uniref:HEPN domain-containing protein n=1 Tax=Candidatus Nitronereus thalassa TaxID=3020898 RepID=A0ABU3K526_9BACT|nr:hypothetical protein [Candidatus Nitronereus thalassa]MDT7041467.1 hypothetical protein [Candidatus Nitronereus thalassa]